MVCRRKCRENCVEFLWKTQRLKTIEDWQQFGVKLDQMIDVFWPWEARTLVNIPLLLLVAYIEARSAASACLSRVITVTLTS